MKKIAFYDDKNVIYVRLKHFRKSRRITQEALAAKLQTMNVNIDQHALSEIENNRRIVTDYELVCICRALHVSIDEMLSDFYEKYPD